MIRSRRQKLLWAFLLAVVSVATAQAQNYTKPKVRAITGFVRLNPTDYARQITEALSVLREAQGEFEKQGYQVETIRIVTQPLGELVSEQSDAQALAFLRVLDELSVKQGFLPSVGPAMLRDTDDPRIMRFLARVLYS